MNVGSLFTGIGGIDLGLERAGMRVAWQCELDPYCRRVLRKHWPHVPIFDDIRSIHHGDAAPVDVICGGFPCQPVSVVGRRRGREDERWLWPEFARIVRLLQPRFVLVENVTGILTHGMGDVVGDLAALGYDAEWDCIPAAAVGAPHRRDRVWIVAYPRSPGRWEDARGASRDEAADAGRPAQDDHKPHGDGEGSRAGHVADADGQRRNGRSRIFGTGWRRQLEDGCEWEPEPDVGRVADGVPARVDRLRSLGNAVVPQVVEAIGRRMMEAA